MLTRQELTRLVFAPHSRSVMHDQFARLQSRMRPFTSTGLAECATAFCDLKQGPMLSRADTALRAAHLSPSARRLLPSLLLCGAEEPLDADGVAEVVLGRELLGLELLPVVGSAHLRMRASTTFQRSRIVCGAPRGAGVRATSMRRAVRLRLRLRAGTIRRQPTAAAMLHGARRADHPSTLICSLAMPPDARMTDLRPDGAERHVLGVAVQQEDVAVRALRRRRADVRHDDPAVAPLACAHKRQQSRHTAAGLSHVLRQHASRGRPHGGAMC